MHLQRSSSHKKRAITIKRPMNKYKKKDAPPSDCNGDNAVTVRSSIIVWTITSEPLKPSLSSVEKMIIMLFNKLKFSVFHNEQNMHSM